MMMMTPMVAMASMMQLLKMLRNDEVGAFVDGFAGDLNDDNGHMLCNQFPYVDPRIPSARPYCLTATSICDSMTAPLFLCFC